MKETDGSQPPKEDVKNLHVVVPVSFHRRVKMLCAMQSLTLKNYTLMALEEKVARDEEAIRKGPEPK